MKYFHRLFALFITTSILFSCSGQNTESTRYWSRSINWTTNICVKHVQPTLSEKIKTPQIVEVHPNPPWSIEKFSFKYKNYELDMFFSPFPWIVYPDSICRKYLLTSIRDPYIFEPREIMKSFQGSILVRYTFGGKANTTSLPLSTPRFPGFDQRIELKDIEMK